jgi:hypothetical protein
MKEMAMFSQFQDFQKSQKKAAKKRKASETNNSDSDSSYLQSTFKHDGLVRKRKKINPTTEIVGEFTINGKKQQIRILVGTGSTGVLSY